MIVFYSIAVFLALLAAVWVIRPLLSPPPDAGVSSEKLNAAIYRDQLKVLEQDLARGAISASDYETTQDELQLRLLDDIEEPATALSTTGKSVWNPRYTAAVVAVLIPLGAGGMYWWLGTPAAIDPVANQKATNDKIGQMVDGLAARLKANPDNPKGWAMLARSYKVMGRLEDAEQAFKKAGDIVNTDADLLVDYADLLAVRAGDDIEGQPLALVNKALTLNPKHPMGLMMSGVAAYRRSDFASAVAQWEKLLLVMEPGSPDAQQLESDIAEARAKAGMPGSAKVTSRQATGARPSANDFDPSKLPPVDATITGPVTQEKINQMVERLAERLKANPDDLAGWAKLARAYKVQKRLAEAEQAYVKAGKLVDGDPDLLTQYADLLAIRANNNLEGRPLALVNKALALNPKHPMALMMAGSAAYRRADYAQAVAYWEKVLTVLDPASSDATQVNAEIADARARGGQDTKHKATP